MAAAVALGAAACGGKSGLERTDRSPTSATREGAVQTPQQGAGGIPALVDRLGPSVVAIHVQGAQGASAGSGVVWDGEGHIVTNSHVIQAARTVEVRSARGRRLRARVVADDPRTDLAVVKLAAGDLPPAPFARALPAVGSLAVALGSPLGFENTVTAGIVSGLDRSLPTSGNEPSLVGLLQTDAAISPGNSGGALVGADGEVIGINVAYLPPQQTGAVSIGFAIPAPTVRDIVTQLVRNGRVEHPYLGVQLAPGEGGAGGVVVAAVEAAGPAASAGMREGDVVTQIGDRDVAAIEDVYAGLRGRTPGDTVAVEVQRDGARRTLDVKLGERPEPASGVLPGGGG